MKICKDYPPNIEDIKKVLTPQANTIFTYGDTIYAPNGGNVDVPLITHEAVHMLQQGNDPKGWWDKYLTDTTFRFEQEAMAYQHQYRRFCSMNKDRNWRNKYLIMIAQDLSSEMYGNLCTTAEAMRVIKR